MIRPQRLRHKDNFGVFSPSEPITSGRRERFDHGIEILHSNNFGTVLGEFVLKNRSYMAGTVDERVSDIHHLLRDKTVKALFASWGGKSCNQLLNKIDYRLVKSARKAILGFSDVCVLLNAITVQTGLITFHGPNIVGKLDETAHADLALLLEPFVRMREINLLGKTETVETRILQSGNTRGRLFGGNLSTFVLGLVGSRYMPNMNGNIFFWESASEEIEIVDQFLFCLKNTGMFERIGGMIIGDFIKPASEDFRKRDPFEMILDVVGKYGFPILYCPTFGHPEYLENPILPIGGLCELNTSTARLSLLEPIID